MRGLEKNCTRRLLSTDGHGDSMTNSAQWGRVGEKTTWRMDLRQTDRQTDRHVDSMTDPAQRAESVKKKEGKVIKGTIDNLKKKLLGT